MPLSEIYRTAEFLLAETAPVGAAQARCLERIDQLSAAGDRAGREAWIAILDAVGELQQKKPRVPVTTH